MTLYLQLNVGTLPREILNAKNNNDKCLSEMKENLMVLVFVCEHCDISETCYQEIKDDILLDDTNYELFEQKEEETVIESWIENEYLQGPTDCDFENIDEIIWPLNPTTDSRLLLSDFKGFVNHRNHSTNDKLFGHFHWHQLRVKHHYIV